MFAPDEMGQTESGLLDHVQAQWGDRFAAAFPGQDGPTVEQVTEALAAYERVLPSPSRFDRYLDGDREALSRQERRGSRLFRRNCEFCHGGVAVGGQGFERLGEEVPWPEDRREDQGLYEVTGEPDDRMRFVVPSLRNVSKTGPWFHDGSVQTLEEAVRLMGRHQLGRSFRTGQLDALVAFLRSLDTEEIPPWAYPEWDGVMGLI
ncbi:MAG: cytochrome c peroxidase [Myxococcota bacterium]